MDHDKKRRPSYLCMPEVDMSNCVMIHEQRGDTYQVAEVAEKPPRMGTAGFPTRVLDLKKGLLCTYTASSRAAWIVDVIGGIERYRQVELEEVFEARA